MEDCEREIIYLALSNLIVNCIELLESNEKVAPNKRLSKEDMELAYFILDRAQVLEEKYRGLVSDDSKIKRPNWDLMRSD